MTEESISLKDTNIENIINNDTSLFSDTEANSNVDISKSKDIQISKKKLSSPKGEIESEKREQKSKSKRKSRLSLNSESKTKDKPKEDTGQVSIMSFLKKISSPKPEENDEIDGIIKENSLITADDLKELENSKKVPSTYRKQSECRKESDDSTFSIETKKKKSKQLIKRAKKSIEKAAKVEENDSGSKSKKNKIKSKEVENNYKKKIKDNNLDKSINGEGNCEKESIQLTPANVTYADALDKKVRFSENVEEYSPEPFQKKSKSTIIDESKIDEAAEVTSVENAAKIETKIENVFAFMMDSRNRSIGQNLIGKDAEKVQEIDEVQHENKKKLSVRKAIFQEWADKKGGQQKRLEEEEKEIVIEHKLKKRAKRLKNMLTQEISLGPISSDDGNNEKIIKKKKHKPKPLIASESECTQEQVEIVEKIKSKENSSGSLSSDNVSNEKIIKKKKHKPKPLITSESECIQEQVAIVEKIKSKENSSGSLSSDDASNEKIIKKKKHQPKPLITSESECTQEQVEIVEKIKSSSGKRKRKAISIEVLSEDVENEDSDAIDDDMFKKHKKPKLTVLSDNSSNEDKLNQKTIVNSSFHQTELSNFFGILNKSVQSESANKNKSKLQMKRKKEDNSKTPKGKSKLTLKKNEDSLNTLTSNRISNLNTDIDNHYSLEDESMSFGISDKIHNQETQVIENSNHVNMQDLLTPRSFKKWKMRLKISLESINDEEIEKLVQCVHSSGVQMNEKDEPKAKRVHKKIINFGSELDSDSSNPPSSIKDNKVKRSKSEKKDGKSVKLAPIFIKSKPKSKPSKADMAAIEARKKFLHSEMPDSLKKNLKKDHKLEEIEHPLFPLISHITIKPTDEQLANTINYWNLPVVDLKLKHHNFTLPNIKPLDLGSFTSITSNNSDTHIFCMTQKISRFKNYLRQIKSDNPDYPVYRAFRFLYNKSAENVKPDSRTQPAKTPNTKKRKRRRKPKVPLKNDAEDNSVIPATVPSKQEIWTDLYKPNSSEEIFGNHGATIQLKDWLKTWLQFSEEINVQRNRNKNRDSDSGSDFEDRDINSRDSIALPGNTVILCGPHGSGKTMTVYTLCNELGINVLEVNASSKRTGKSLLQELQEATQSHQVRKIDGNNPLTSFLKKEDGKSSSQSSDNSKSSSQSSDSQSNRKMCLLLIEDVDIVFEQDENFISALNQLLTTSKRPVILTTTDSNCLHLKKFFTQHKIINFYGLSAKVLAVWLQIICLIDGLYVNKDTLAELLDWNNGDIRCTLVQLQFWVCSGGQLKSTVGDNKKKYITYNSENVNEDSCSIKDDSANISWLNDENSTEHQEDTINETFVHNGCLESFGHFKNDYNELYSSYLLDLGDTWWNLPNLLGISLPLQFNKVTENRTNVNKENCAEKNFSNRNKEMDITSLKHVSNICEALAMTDVTYKKLNVDCDFEPVQRNRGSRTINSLELNEDMEYYSANRDLANEWCHHLFNVSVNIYKNFVKKRGPEENYSYTEGKRWRTRQYKCHESFQESIPFMCHLDHNSVNMDYLSTLRTIARSETIRANNNSKRRNRFYNYLRGVGIDCNDSLFKTACDVFHCES